MAEAQKITLPIPGTKKKVKLPRWALFAALGVGVVAVVLLSRKKGAAEGAYGELSGETVPSAPSPEEPLPSPEIPPIPEYPPAPGYPEYPPAPEYTYSTVPTVEFVPGEGQVQTGQLMKSATAPSGPYASSIAAAPQEVARPPEALPKIFRPSKAFEMTPQELGAARMVVFGGNIAAARGLAFLQEAWRNVIATVLPNFPHAVPPEDEEETKTGIPAPPKTNLVSQVLQSIARSKPGGVAAPLPAPSGPGPKPPPPKPPPPKPPRKNPPPPKSPK